MNIDKIKTLLKNRYFQILAFVLLWVFTINESNSIYVDMYNFEQLKNVQNILNKLDKNSYEFENLKEYNKKFNQNIKPIKKCYFMADRNRFFENNKKDWGYVFWFKLESILYRLEYLDNYYAYPKYDLPYWELCLVNVCTDGNKNLFRYTISNPCWD